jgi:hypothetical protein
MLGLCIAIGLLSGCATSRAISLGPAGTTTDYWVFVEDHGVYLCHPVMGTDQKPACEEARMINH